VSLELVRTLEATGTASSAVLLLIWKPVLVPPYSFKDLGKGQCCVLFSSRRGSLCRVRETILTSSNSVGDSQPWLCVS